MPDLSASLRIYPCQTDPERGCTGNRRSALAKLLSPSRSRLCIDHMRQTLSLSERRICRTLGQHRSTQRKVPRGLPDEERLTEDVIELTKAFGRHGYRFLTGMQSNSVWHVNHKRVERIWRREGLKVPQKQRKKGRFWLNDAHVSGCDQSLRTMCCLTILSKIEPMMGGSSEHWTLLMSSPRRPSPLKRNERSIRPLSLMR